MSFKSIHSFEKRKEESDRIISKYPDRIPIICEKSSSTKDNDIPTIDKIKYLVPINLTMGQFIYVIRSRMKLRAEKAIFIFVGNTIPSSTSDLQTLYSRYKDKDGFLYMYYSGENTFGNKFA